MRLRVDVLILFAIKMNESLFCQLCHISKSVLLEKWTYSLFALAKSLQKTPLKVCKWYATQCADSKMIRSHTARQHSQSQTVNEDQAALRLEQIQLILEFSKGALLRFCPLKNSSTSTQDVEEPSYLRKDVTNVTEKLKQIYWTAPITNDLYLFRTKKPKTIVSSRL